MKDSVAKEIKSWHIAMIGLFILAAMSQKVYLFRIIANSKFMEFSPSSAIFSGLFISVMLLIPLLLLCFNKTKAIGAIITLLFGFAALVSGGLGGIFGGIFFIISGCYYFWKKV